MNLKFFIGSFIIIVFLLVLIIYGLIYLVNKKEKIDNNYILDEFTTNYYRNELDKIIEYNTVYYIDSTFGQNFSTSNSINNDIPNDEIYNAYTETLSNINECISEKMKLSLSDSMGINWLNKYIEVQTLSIILNYTHYSINQLTIAKFTN